MTNKEIIALHGNKKLIPLIRGMLKAASEQEVSSRDFSEACRIAEAMIQKRLIRKGVSEVIYDIESTLDSIEKGL